MDVSILIVVAVSLAFVSLLIAVQMQAAGASVPEITTVVAELWAVFSIWIAVLSVAARGAEGPGEFRQRFAALPGYGKTLIGLGIAFSVAIFIHLQVTLRRGMRGDRGG